MDFCFHDLIPGEVFVDYESDTRNKIKIDCWRYYVASNHKHKRIGRINLPRLRSVVPKTTLTKRFNLEAGDRFVHQGQIYVHGKYTHSNCWNCKDKKEEYINMFHDVELILRENNNAN